MNMDLQSLQFLLRLYFFSVTKATAENFDYVAAWTNGFASSGNRHLNHNKHIVINYLPSSYWNDSCK